MGYFDFLPNVGYTNIETGNIVIAKNILTRGKILDILRESASGALEYQIRDEEKPETLANRVYGRSDYHWIILMYNEILDPYFQWPLSINEFEKHMETVYGGQTLYIDPVSLFDLDKNDPLDRKARHFDPGDMVEQRNSDGEVLASARIRKWDPSYYKLIVDQVVGSFELQGIALKNSNTSTPIDDRTELLHDIFSTTTNGKRISAPLVRINRDNKYALHHFETDKGEILSPLYRPRYLTEETNIPYETPWNIMERYALGNSENFDLGVDYKGDPFGRVVIVTNIAHEERINEKKRIIRVMRPEYIDALLRDFRKLFLSGG